MVKLVGKVRGLSGRGRIGYESDFFFEFLSVGKVLLKVFYRA